VRAFLALPLLALVALATPGGAAENGPTTVVEQTTSGVVGVLSQQDLPTDEKRRRIEQIVYGSIDFDTLSKLVLARNWTRLTPAQQVQFTEEFKKHLSLTYARNIEGYKNEKVQVVGDREEARGDWTVKTRIVRQSAEPIEVDYRLRSRDGTWRIIDVIIEGVSLVSNFRSQFQGIVANEGPARLLDLLKEKNAKGEPLKS
jgi:phospholipid transport system substrate-binding protein